jgi:LmbE family N-acetylglucosaminyl deacetylase
MPSARGEPGARLPPPRGAAYILVVASDLSVRNPSRLARASRVGGALLLGVSLVAAASRAATVRPPRGPLPLVLPASPRVLVVAPHPDDETIAAGGLIARLTRRGARVRVLCMTNGDGYLQAVRQDLHEEKPSDTDYAELGELRQQEAIAATARLGLRRQDLIFQGFPDGGLAQLWRDHWSRSSPYTSPYTKEDSPPAPDGAEYDGQDLTSLITRELRAFRPTVVVIPHPYDAHLDHAHASYFVIEALDALQATHVLPERLLVLTYLVHLPTWPSAGGEHDRLAPPSAREIPDTIWYQIDLTPAELAAKQAALGEYRSQLRVLSDLLHRFLRPNELFGRVKSGVLDRIAEVH